MPARLDSNAAAAVMRAAGLQPLTPYPGSSARWPCMCDRCGREVTPTLKWVKKGGGCRLCKGKGPVPPEDAEALMRAAGFIPLMDYPGAGKPWLCRCAKCNRNSSPTYSNVRGGSGCRHCKGTFIEPSEAVETMIEAGLEPLTEYPGSDVPWKSRCATCGREVTPRLASLRKGHHGCRYCAVGGLTASEATAAARSYGMEPMEPYPGMNQPWPGICMTCGSVVQPRLSTLRKGFGPCKTCSAREAARKRIEATAQGWQSLGPAHFDARGDDADPSQSVVTPAEIMRDAGVTPLEPFPGVAKPWRCKCDSCARVVLPRLHHVRRGTSACPYCTGARVAPEVAEEEMRAAGMEPLEPFPGAAQPWRSRCLECGHEGSPRLTNLRMGSGPCAHCGGTAKREECEAIAIMVDHGLRPIDAYPGRNKPWRSTCMACGARVSPRLGIVMRRDSGCRVCSGKRFDPSQEGYIYLAYHPGWDTLKVGITNNRQSRLDEHVKNGWEVIHVQADDGWIVEAAEREVLRWFRKEVGLPSYLDRESMPQGGWTETISAESLDPRSAIERIKGAIATAKSRHLPAGP